MCGVFRVPATLIVVLGIAASCHRTGAPTSTFGQPAGSYLPSARVAPVPSPAPEVTTRPPVTEVGSSETLELSLRNDCARAVGIFWGEMPNESLGFSYAIRAGGSVMPRAKSGAKVWLLDGAGNGISSATIAREATELEIEESCKAITARHRSIPTGVPVTPKVGDAGSVP